MKIENEISNLEIIKIVHIHDFKPELTKGKHGNINRFHSKKKEIMS